MSDGAVVHVSTVVQYDTIIRNPGGKLVVVDFFGAWCPPCKRIVPKVAEFAQTHKEMAIFLKVDVDELSEISEREEVRAMPTFAFFKNGAKVDSFTGADETMLADYIIKYTK